MNRKYIVLVGVAFLLALIGSYFAYGYFSKTRVEPLAYVSEYQADQPDLATNIMVDTDAIEAELKDEKRQILTFDRPLSEEDISNLEGEHNISIKKSIAGNRYVVQMENEEKATDIEGVLGAEVDAPVKIAGQTVDWGVQRIGAPQIWELSSGCGVTVAVIDTGVELTHTDLAANIVSGYDFVNDDSSANDDNGHGTHVAGIISSINNGAGTVGVAHCSKIMPLKVLNADGYGYVSDVASAVYYAADNGANIINMSLGTTSDSDVLRSAVDYASRRGVLIISAAGNNYGQGCLYPAKYAGSKCVMATDQDNRLATFSNVGGDVSAPGVSIYSAYKGNSYVYLSGTSMAAPHVAGAVGNIMNSCGCSAMDAWRILVNSTVDLGTEGFDSLFGHGLVDLVAAIGIEEEVIEEIEEEVIEEVEEDLVDDATTAPEQPGRPDTTPTPRGDVPAKILQRLIINKPKLDRGRRVTLSDSSKLEVVFTLSPIVSNSDIDRIELLIDNNIQFTTREQSGDYEVDFDGKSNGQYFIRVVAYFKDRSVWQERFLVNLQLADNDNRGNSRANQDRRRVLGVFDIRQY